MDLTTTAFQFTCNKLLFLLCRSNCVLSLSLKKEAVLKEAARVLRVRSL